MHEVSQRGAAPMQHAGPENVLDEASWDDLHAFLVCTRHGSFRRASDASGVNSATLARKVERLEEQLGNKLFVRLQTGLVLTDEGKQALEKISAMELLSFDVYRGAAKSAANLTGTVRVAATDGPGIFWILPRLIDFQNTYRQLVVDLRCAMEIADVARLEAEISIQYQRPTNPDLVATKLGRLHIYPFASETYARTYGLPQTKDDWKNHRVIRQSGPQLDETAYARLYGMDSFEGITGMRVNSSTAMLYAVERSAGIGLLPSCTTALGAPLVAVDIGVNHSMDFWLTYHSDLRTSRKHMVVVDWLKRIFDPQVYPCFKDRFIHPNELVDLMGRERQAYGLNGFLAANPL